MSDEKKLSEQVRNCAYIVQDPHPTDTEAGEREVLGLNQVADEIAALEQRLEAAEADLSRLNVVADTVCHDPQGIGPSAVMFKQCKRIAELERELAETHERSAAKVRVDGVVSREGNENAHT